MHQRSQRAATKKVGLLREATVAEWRHIKGVSRAWSMCGSQSKKSIVPAKILAFVDSPPCLPTMAGCAREFSGAGPFNQAISLQGIHVQDGEAPAKVNGIAEMNRQLLQGRQIQLCYVVLDN